MASPSDHNASPPTPCWTFPEAEVTGGGHGVPFPLAVLVAATVSSSDQSCCHGAAPASQTRSLCLQLSCDHLHQLFLHSVIQLSLSATRLRGREGGNPDSVQKQRGMKEVAAEEASQNCPSRGCLSRDHITVHDLCLSLTQPLIDSFCDHRQVTSLASKAAHSRTHCMFLLQSNPL